MTTGSTGSVRHIGQVGFVVVRGLCCRPFDLVCRALHHFGVTGNKRRPKMKNDHVDLFCTAEGNVTSLCPSLCLTDPYMINCSAFLPDGTQAMPVEPGSGSTILAVNELQGSQCLSKPCWILLVFCVTQATTCLPQLCNLQVAFPCCLSWILNRKLGK